MNQAEDPRSGDGEERKSLLLSEIRGIHLLFRYLLVLGARLSTMLSVLEMWHEA